MINYIKKLTINLSGCIIMLAACSSSGNETEPVNPPAPEPAPSSGDVTLLVTTTSLSQDLSKTTVDFGKGASLAPTRITLDPSTRYQEMDGFGAAITGSTCFNLMQMQPEDRTKFLKETFSEKDGFGFSYIRISIGCSDFSLSEYTCCDEKGIDNFALQTEENDYIIPILKEILAINPTIKIMAAPWTPPRWMKVKDLTSKEPFNLWTSGQLNPDYYQDYATYFVKWIQAFQAKGINIYAVTPQNEPLNRGNSASLFMGWDEQRDFIKNALGPKFEASALKTKIYSFDHNYNYDNMAQQQGYPTKIYQDADAAKYISGAAFHNYGGSRDELNTVHRANPDKELLFTETSIGTWNDGRNLQARLLDDMKEVALGTAINWCRGAIVWNLMLDSDLGPNREGGCRTCYGAVDIDNTHYKTIRRNSHYYIIAHMSAVVKPGAVRIASSNLGDANVMYSAFTNPDGSYALVLMNNNTQAKKITIDDGKNNFAYDVPAKSIVSYRWKK